MIGGSGVSYTLAMLRNVIRCVGDLLKPVRCYCSSTCVCSESLVSPRTRRVLFLWMIRDDAHALWFLPTLSDILATLPSPGSEQDLVVDIRIFVTQGNTEKLLSTRAPMNHITFSQGRPDLETILRQEIGATEFGEDIAIDGAS